MTDLKTAKEETDTRHQYPRTRDRSSGSSAGSWNLPTITGARLHRAVQLLSVLIIGPFFLILTSVRPSAVANPSTVALMSGVAMVAGLGGLLLSWVGRHERGVWFSAVVASLALFLGAAVTQVYTYRMLFYLTIPVLFLGLQVPRRQLLTFIGFILAGILVVALLFVPPEHRRFVLLSRTPLVTFVLGLIYFAFWYRDQAEAAREADIAAREARYRSLLESMTDGFMIYVDERVVDVNSGSARIFGYDPTEVSGMSLWSFVAEESVPVVANRMRLSDYPPTEILGSRRDGSRFRLEFTARSIEYDGKPARMVAVRDINDRYEREQEAQLLQRFAAGLRKAQSRVQMPGVILSLLADLFAVERCALVLAPPDGELVVELAHGNPALDSELCARVLALGEAEWASPDGGGAGGVIPLIAGADHIGCLYAGRENTFSSLDRRILIGIGGMISRALQRATRHQQTAYYASELEERVAERTRELTDANERLKELDRLKSKFVSDVTHELRTPVTNLGLYLELLEVGPPEKRSRYMKTLKQQADRLHTLLENILDLSRLDDGRDKIEWEDLDLSAVVADVVGSHLARAEAAGLSLHYEAGQLPPIRGNRTLLTRIAINLISNAINYTQEGFVRVETIHRPEQALLELRVSDSGPGIEEQDLPHLFERFYRGRVAGSSNIPGTGLGLSIVREIVDTYGGTVRVESEIGEGSCFIVQLPLHAVPDAAGSRTRAAPY